MENARCLGVYDTVALGFNYRMSEIHAAIGIEQVKKAAWFLDSSGLKTLPPWPQLWPMCRGYGSCPNLMDSHRHSCHYCLGRFAG
jgi:perosamine synthetase